MLTLREKKKDYSISKPMAFLPQPMLGLGLAVGNGGSPWTILNSDTESESDGGS
jgi:hypothetical protein